MTKSSSKTIWYLVGLSACLHTLAFVLWFYTSNDKASSISKYYAINITLSSGKYSAENKNNNKQITPLKKSPIVNHDKPAPTEKNFNKTEKTTVADNKNDFNVLHKLLHTAINTNKHYPLSALRLSREGTVKISFQLLNSGEINDLKVANSSGYNALDRAALKAIKNIQPFKPARQYIASVEKFILDIKFQL